MKGFVSKMEEGMGACDCIITKVSSSALTIMNIILAISAVVLSANIVITIFLIGGPRDSCRSNDKRLADYSE